MKRDQLICLTIGSLLFGSVATLIAAQATQGPSQDSAATERTAQNATGKSGTSSPSLDRPLITIAGLCEHSAPNSKNSSCKTVITKGDLEAMINALEPGMPKHAQREFALHYADALVMAEKAQQLGQDKGRNYQEQMRLARVEILYNALKNETSEEASDISDKDIEDY